MIINNFKYTGGNMNSYKLYQDDSYMTRATANVVSCVRDEDKYRTILDKTIFYPHMSGGQPKDEGTINGIPVTDVQEHGNEIIHVTADPLSGEVELEIDYATRFDYMQQHTGQHILSCALGNLFEANTIGFHMSKDYTTIDIDADLNDALLVRAEDYSNNIIYSNIDVSVRTLPYDEAVKLSLRKLPPKIDSLRITQIADKDICACGGTHVSRTGEVGMIKVVRAEKYKSGLRIEFLCGRRALVDYNTKNKTLLHLSSMLSCQIPGLNNAIENLKLSEKQLSKTIGALNTELNKYRAADFMTSAVEFGSTMFIVKALADADMKDMRSIVSVITQEQGYVAVLVGEGKANCSIVMGQSEDQSFDLKSLFNECSSFISAKGGGSNRLIQGSGPVTGKSQLILDTAIRFLGIK